MNDIYLMKKKTVAILLGTLGVVLLICGVFGAFAFHARGLYVPPPAFPEPTQVLITIQNFGQEVVVDNTLYNVENAVEQEYLYALNCRTEVENEPLPLAPAGWTKTEEMVSEAPTLTFVTFNVPKTAYERALTIEGPVYSTIATEEVSPLTAPSPAAPAIDILPIATTFAAISLIAVAIWVGYRQAWGDATSTLLERGLHNMTVRDVEIVGYIMQKEEFTIPELMKLSKASKITVWRTVQRLVEQGLVEPTDQTRPAANGLGGRGKPSQVYRYVGKKE
jgi:hypothetical protein